MDKFISLIDLNKKDTMSFSSFVSNNIYIDYIIALTFSLILLQCIVINIHVFSSLNAGTNKSISPIQVTEDLLSEAQVATVIALLQRAVGMVKENPGKAVSSSLTWIETPTSSPTTNRKNYKFTEMDAAKVSDITLSYKL